MILADKIINLRKKCGWSQEELADQLGISRQSVSKWESGMSIPEIDKIIKLSELFGVSTDYLLKDELEEVVPGETVETSTEEVRNVTIEEANAYMDLAQQVSKRMAAGVALCILSPITLIVLGGVAECTGMLGENIAGGIGMVVLFVMIAIGLSILIPNGMKLEKYEYLETEAIALQYGVSGIVSKKKEAYGDTYRTRITIGVILCVLGVVPLFVAGAFEAAEMVEVCTVGILLAMVAIGVYTLVGPSIIYGSFQKLLQEGDYTEENKRIGKKIAYYPAIYWCLITAIYLGKSFGDNAWETTWVIWPVAGVVYAALHLFLHMLFKTKNK